MSGDRKAWARQIRDLAEELNLAIDSGYHYLTEQDRAFSTRTIDNVVKSLTENAA